jgi:hypothetical protein
MNNLGLKAEVSDKKPRLFVQKSKSKLFGSEITQNHVRPDKALQAAGS